MLQGDSVFLLSTLCLRVPLFYVFFLSENHILGIPLESFMNKIIDVITRESSPEPGVHRKGRANGEGGEGALVGLHK